MNYSDALAWLYSTQQFGIKLGLENTHRLLEALGHPESDSRFLHVAGTNGKGSVCAMLDSILRTAGHRTGLYTSPHLVNFRERIRVNGEMMPESEVARILTEIHDATSGWLHAPTYFEISTVLALRHFADAKTDYVVLETGMGGRLDATNAVMPLVSVLTPIAMDHAQWLGNTLDAVAGEKAGILKPDVPAVSAPQRPIVVSVLEEYAVALGVPLRFVEAAAAMPVNLRGAQQSRNAALAIEALHAARIDVTEEAIREGLATVVWPGRFQELGRFVLDGAHNPHGSAQLAETWAEEFGDERAVVIFGALRDKDYAGMMIALAPISEEVWFVPVASQRGEKPERIAKTCPGRSRIFSSLDEALAAAEGQSRRVLVTGSLFLVGEVLEILAPG
jgi:dihydrofolate synthase / folylpolyglutamate synthase